MDMENGPIEKLPNQELIMQSSVEDRFKSMAKFNQKSNSKGTYDNDNYLMDLLKVLKVKSLIVGVGGAGNNTISRLQEIGVENAETININTDAHDLFHSNSDHKILIGKERCSGLGSGNDPIIGEEAAEEDSFRIREIFSESKPDIVFVTCGLGGGTGTGAAPIVAREAKRVNAVVVGFCSVPFKSEGAQRRTRAKWGLKNLARYSDSLIPFPNDNLLQFLPKAPLLTCFKIMDEILVKGIREVVSLINNCGLVNIDYADIKKIFLKNGKYPSGMIGITESLGREKDLIVKAKLALNNPLLRPDLKKVEKCVVSITGNHRLSLSKVNKIISTISGEIPEEAALKFGNTVNPNFGRRIRIMVLGKGPISPYVYHAVNSEAQLPVN